jgi:hypothetical protein
MVKQGIQEILLVFILEKEINPMHAFQTPKSRFKKIDEFIYLA